MALKEALDEPEATVTLLGTVTEPLLLARLTTKPPLDAAEFSETVQESVPAPVIDDEAQVNPLSVAVLDPLDAVFSVSE